MGVIASIVWALIIGIAGSLISLSLSNWVIMPNFILFLTYFIFIGLVVGIIAGFPLFLIIRKPGKRPILKLLLGIIIFFPLIITLLNSGLLGIGLQPLPKPPGTKIFIYRFQIINAISPESKAVFAWKENITLDEKFRNIRNTAALYDKRAFEKKWITFGYSNGVEGSFTTCEDVVNKGISWYQQSLSNPPVSSFHATCSFELSWIGSALTSRIDLNLDEDGGEITLP